MLTTVGSGVLLVRVSDSADLSLTSTTLLVALPAIAPATGALGYAMNLGGRCGQTFRSAFLSALPGYAPVGIGLAMQSWDGLGLAALGGIGLMLVPPFTATDGYRRSVTPAVLSDPATRAFVPGVRFRVGL